MKKIVYVMFLFGNICLAQNLLGNLATFEQSARVFNDLKYSIDGIDGHQYFLDDWGTGKIIINDSINAVQAKIQFDMVSGEPIIGNASADKKGFILRDKSVTGFVINNTKFIRIQKNMFLEPVERNYFVTPLFSKENYLIVNYSKFLKEPYALRNGYNDGELNKKYLTRKKFYILNKDNKYISLRLKKKEILKVLSDKEKELKVYVKNKDLNLKNEKDVGELLTYYHSL